MTLLQSLARKKTAIERVEVLRQARINERRRVASTAMQNAQRRKIAQREYAKLVAEKARREHFAATTAAATQMQSAARGWAAREERVGSL